jgi:hypothetical protein
LPSGNKEVQFSSSTSTRRPSLLDLGIGRHGPCPSLQVVRVLTSQWRHPTPDGGRCSTERENTSRTLRERSFNQEPTMIKLTTTQSRLSRTQVSWAKSGHSFMLMRLSQNVRRANSAPTTVYTEREISMSSQLFQLEDTSILLAPMLSLRPRTLLLLKSGTSITEAELSSLERTTSQLLSKPKERVKTF